MNMLIIYIFILLLFMFIDFDWIFHLNFCVNKEMHIQLPKNETSQDMSRSFGLSLFFLVLGGGIPDEKYQNAC